jgi:site-specific DNA recombinase
MSEQLPFDGYIRVSRVNGREGDSYQSPERQRETIERLAASNNLRIGEIVTEEDVKGSTKATARELDRIIRKVENGESGGIIVWKVSRYSRSLLDGIVNAARIVGWERDTNKGRIIGSELDTGQPMGKALLGLMLGLAEEELDAIRATWKAVGDAARARGVHISARRPFGYRREKGQPLMLDPDEAAAVEVVYRRRARGHAWDAICADLNAEGFRTPILEGPKGQSGITGGGNPWQEGALRKLVQNPIYKGEPRGGAILPEELRIVSPRLWAEAQPEDGGRRPRSPEGSLLGGLVHCGVCGSRMIAETQTKRGVKFVAYRCRTRAHGAEPCPQPMTVSGRLLEPYVTEVALDHLRHSHLPPVEISLRPYEDAVADARFDLDEFQKAALAEGLKPAAIAGMLAQYQARVDAAQEALEQAQIAAGDPRGPLSEEQVVAGWDDMTIPQRRELLHELFTEITVTRGSEWIGERTVLTWKTPLVAPLPPDQVLVTASLDDAA